MRAAGATYSIPGVYRYPKPRAEGFPRVRTDVAGFVGVAGPRHLGKAVAVDDWKGFVTQFRRDEKGKPIEAPPGGMLDGAVRDFFANGGRRVWIVNVAEAVETFSPVLLNEMLGIAGIEPAGLELLLRQDEVSIVALPDLDAVQAVADPWPAIDLPGNPCFAPCLARRPADGGAGSGARVVTALGGLFSEGDLLWAQRYLLSRLLRTRWRWFAILAPPPGKTPAQAIEWRARLTRNMAAEDGDIGALYWPWLFVQERPGAPLEARSPVGAVAGVFAQVDIEIGPHAAPANRRMLGAVGLQADIGDEDNALVYDAGVNVLRAFPGDGIQLWGARTLRWLDRESRFEPLAFVNARRCLSAIARSVEVIGGPLVLQPNNAMLRIRLHQLVTDYMLGVFRAGALMGDIPEEGFFVKVETERESAEGQLVCEVGVALAAPAEFIVFRIGREGAVSELDEAA